MTIRLRTELSVSDAWVDITSRVRLEPGIDITRGRRDQQSAVTAGQARLTLDNRDGDFSNRNPASPYYGLIGRNTPLRQSVVLIEDDFGRISSNGWGAADFGGSWVNSGGSASDFSVSSGTARHSLASAGTSIRSHIGANIRDSVQYVTVTIPQVAVGDSIDVGPLSRWGGAGDYYILVLHCHNDATYDLRIRVQESSVFTTLFTSAILGTYGAGSQFRMRMDTIGKVVLGKVWPLGDAEPVEWQAQIYDTTHTVGEVGLRSNLQASWSGTVPQLITYDDYDVLDVRFAGEVAQWPQRWDPSGRDVHVPIEANGIMRRLSQSAALQAAIRRYITRLTIQPEAFWTLEDGPLVSLGAALVGVEPMRAFTGAHPSGAVIGYPEWGQGTLAPWLPSVVSRSGNIGLSVLWSRVAMPGFANTWTVDFAYASGTDAATTALDINPQYLGGLAGWPQLTLVPLSSSLEVTMNAEPEVSTTVAGLFDGNAHHVRLTATQAALKVSWVVYVDGTSVNAGTTTGNMTLTEVENIGLLAEGSTGAAVAQGYVGVWSSPPVVTDFTDALFGHSGEMAGRRIERLCDEETIAFAGFGDLDDTGAMGPQTLDTLLALLEDAATVDQGILFEQRTTLGLAYRTIRSLYNQTALELSYTAPHLVSIEPTDDDLEVWNSVTVQRPSGGMSTSRLLTGPLSVQSPPAGIGEYDRGTVAVAVEVDSQLSNIAGWIRHLGTWDEARYPVLAIELASPVWVADTTLSLAAVAVGMGDLITVTNPPAWLPPDDILTMVQGSRERLDPYSRLIAWNTTPGGPYSVGVLDSATAGRLDTAGSALALAYDDNDTSLRVATTAQYGALWTEAAGQYPLGVAFGGERATITAMTHTATAYVATGTAAHADNASVTPGLPGGATGAGNLLLILAAASSNGIPAAPTGYTRLPVFATTHNVQLFGKIHSGSESAPLVSFTGSAAGESCSAQMASFSGLFYDVSRLVVSAVDILNVSAQDIVYPGLRVPWDNCAVFYVGWKDDDWTSVATISGATEIGEPDTTVADDHGMVWDVVVQTTKADIVSGAFVVTGGAAAVSRGAVFALRYDTQTATVTRSVNGVVKSHTAGTALSLHTPLRLAR